MKSKVINHRNFVLSKNMQTVIKGESITVPNDSLSIQDILDQWTRGVDPLLTKIPRGHDEDPDFDDIPDNLRPDLDDISEMREYVEDIHMRKSKKKESKKEDIKEAKKE